MSRTPLIVLLLLGLALGGALLLTRPGSSPQSAPTVGPITPSAVVLDARTLSIDAAIFERTDGRWADAGGFPVDPARVTALLRTLASAQGETGTGEIGDTIAIEVTTAAGETATLLVERTAFGGSVRVQTADGALRSTDAGLLAAMSGAASGEWRVDDPLAGVDAARLTMISLKSPAHAFQASRAGAAWTLIAPQLEGPVRGHLPALRAIPALLGDLRIQRVLAEPERIPSDGVALAVRFTTGDDEHELTIGPAARAVGSERLGTVRFAGSDERFGVVLTGFDAGAVPTDPLVYTARTAVGARTRTTDVRSVRIETDTQSRTYTRGIDGWSSADAGEVVPAGELDALLELMTQTNGVPGIAAESGFEALALVTLVGYDEGTLETIEAGRSGGVFALRSGELVWGFPDAAPPRILRLVPTAGD